VAPVIEAAVLAEPVGEDKRVKCGASLRLVQGDEFLGDRRPQKRVARTSGLGRTGDQMPGDILHATLHRDPIPRAPVRLEDVPVAQVERLVGTEAEPGEQADQETVLEHAEATPGATSATRICSTTRGCFASWCSIGRPPSTRSAPFR